MSKVPILSTVLELLLTTKKTPINNNNTTPTYNEQTTRKP
mgnify:CR=1 FL=1